MKKTGSQTEQSPLACHCSRIKLFDADKSFVGEFDIQPAEEMVPQVVLWGERVFVQRSDREQRSYYENPSALYRITGPAPSVLRLGW